MAVFKKEKDRLPYGYYTKKDYKNACIMSTILIFSAIALFVLIVNLFGKMFISLSIFFISLFCIILFIGTRFNQFNRLFKQYFKDLDFNKLEEKLQLFMKENLHSESRNELLMQYSNLLLNYDEERAFKMWENVKEPELNKWIYHFYEISMLINQEKYDEAKSLLKIFKIRYSKKIFEYYRNTLELTLLIEINNEEIVDFEKLNFNNKANNLNNLMAYTRAMKYYDTRGKKELAVKYALLIKEANVGFKEIDKIVEKVLNQEN